MTNPNHQIARNLFAAMSTGTLPDELLTEDVTLWTTTMGLSAGRERYQGGVKLFSSLFEGGLTYEIDTLTAEDDRVAAEVRGHGKLIDGEEYANTYMFMIRIRDGKVASVAEHFNPAPLMEKVMPLVQKAMAKMAESA